MTITERIEDQDHTFTVPRGMRIRLRAVSGVISNAEAERIDLVFEQGGVVKIVAVTGTMNPVTGRFSLALGTTNHSETIANIDPVTGDVSYFEDFTATGALPEIWWFSSLRITIETQSGNETFSDVVALYDLEPDPEAK